MQHLIIAVGRWKSGPEKALYEHYRARIQPALELREVEEKKRLQGSELKRREGELLLAAIPDGAQVIALDGSGKTLASRDIAKAIAAQEALSVDESLSTVKRNFQFVSKLVGNLLTSFFLDAELILSRLDLGISTPYPCIRIRKCPL